MKRKLILLALVAFVVAGAGVLPWKTRADATPQRIEITAKRFSFSPAEITLKKGEPVVLDLKSEDVAHGILISELNVNLKVGKHGTAELQFTPDKAGDFVGHCSVFCGAGHGDMMLTVHVTE